MNRIKICFFMLVFILPVFVSQAWNRQYVLELTIITDKQEEFDYMEEINDRQLRDLRFDSRSAITSYLLKARRLYADDIGYRREIYGDENYRMVVVARYRFLVRDKSSGRILLSK